MNLLNIGFSISPMKFMLQLHLPIYLYNLISLYPLVVYYTCSFSVVTLLDHQPYFENH